MNSYVISQFLVIVSMICMGSTYISKNKKNILCLCIIYGIFYGIHYLLLGAITGFFMNGVSIIRNIWFYRNAKRNKKNSKIVFVILVLLGIGIGIFSYQDVFSIVSISASILSTYSVWQDRVKIYRILAILVSIGFIIYGIHIHSLFSILSELILLLVEIIGVIDYFVKTKKGYQLEESI